MCHALLCRHRCEGTYKSKAFIGGIDCSNQSPVEGLAIGSYWVGFCTFALDFELHAGYIATQLLFVEAGIDCSVKLGGNGLQLSHHTPATQPTAAPGREALLPSFAMRYQKPQ